uniref:Testis-expressed sequence 10 protein-like n=1 Tax=Phallusia mammillata TaxID=59560 RepID=A0A6F9DTZ0_9ASCI|nr:testis-expressed sequence 10 protein-like [Phallusia mammillata]
MGKTSKKTKAKKKDFNKVKLKVGKRKPKADNVTNVTFKSQSIYIPEQLKQAQGEILTHRRKSLSDLLTEINHPSPTVRLQALRGIKEILDIDAKCIEHAKMFEKVLKILLDDESTVRKQSLVVLGLLFLTMTESQMRPHFSFVLSHIFCAISHINKHIQKDSLQMIDLCLDHFPALISYEDCCRIIENFIEMISIKQGESGKRSLTMNTSKKETDILWRVRVLARLQKLLDIALGPKLSPGVTKVNFTPCEKWNCVEVGRFMIKGPTGSGLLLRDLDVSVTTTTTSLSIQDLSKSVIPLLIQCWMEVWVGGSMLTGSDDIQLKSMMSCIVTILHQICAASAGPDAEHSKMKSWIYQSYMPLFRKHFFDHFPIEDSAVENRKAKRAKRNVPENNEMLSVNLTICSLASTLIFNHNKLSSADEALLQKTTKFVSKTLTHAADKPTSINPEFLDKVLTFIKQLLSTNEEGKYVDVVQSLSTLYKSLQPRSLMKEKLTTFLLQVFQQHSKMQPQGSGLEEIIAMMPHQLLVMVREVIKHRNILCQITDSSTFHTLTAVLNFSQIALSRKNPTYLKNMHSNCLMPLELLHENSDSIFCGETMCTVCCQCQTQMIECTVPYIEKMSNNYVALFQSICTNLHVNVSNVCYIIDLIMTRFNSTENICKSMDNDEKIATISFLHALLLGEPESKKSVDGLENYQRHETICKHICQFVRQLCHESCRLRNIFISSLQQKLQSTTRISNNTWIGILHLTSVFNEEDNSEFFFLLNRVPNNVENFTEFVSNEFLFSQFKQSLIKV